MKQNFNDCLNRLLKDEGGYTNDPRDPGGPTNFGITITDYRKYINARGTPEDVKKMSVDQAKNIYKQKYWDALSCDDLSSGVDYTCFDYGVNSGLGRPRNVLRRFKSKSGVDLINAINDERLAFLKSLPTFSHFGKGWVRRVNGVRAHSLELANRKTDVTTGPVTGTAIGGAVAWLSQYFHQHQTAILIGAVVTAIVVGSVVHYLRNK